METLCNEITDMILDLLPIKDKKQARLVCHKWRAIADFRLHFEVPFNDETIKWVLPSQHELSHLILQDFSTQLVISSSRSGFTKRVKTITVESLLNPCSIHLLRNCTTLRGLRFSPGSLNTANRYVLQSLEFDHLQELRISIQEPHKKQTKAFCDFAYSVHFPILNTIHFEWLSQLPYESKLFAEEYMAMFELISKHHKTLKILRMKVPKLERSMNMEAVTYDAVNMQRLIDRLSQVQLQELTIKFCSLEGTIPFNLGLYLTRSQKKLDKFVVCGTVFESVEKALAQSSMTMTSFGLLSTSKTNFNCELLKQCSKLQILELFTPLDNAALNIFEIPHSVTNLFLKGPMTNIDIRWIAENLENLKEVAFINPQRRDYYFTVSMFLTFLNRSKVTKLCIWCRGETERIATICHMVNGLTIVYVYQDEVPEVHFITVYIDRVLLGI